MPRGDDDALDLPPLPPLGTDEALGTDWTEVVLDIDPGEPEHVGLDDGTARLDDLDPVSLLDLDLAEEVAPAQGSLAPGMELDLAGELTTEAEEYGIRDGSEAFTAEEWEGDHGIVTLADLGSDDGGETGLEDLAPGLQGDDALPSLPPLDEAAAEEGEPLADELDLGDLLDLGLPTPSEEDEESASPS